MKPLFVFFLTLQIAFSATAIETTIGGKRYSCDPIDEPRDVWTCVIDLSNHGGGYYMGSSSAHATAASKARSDCSASETAMRSLCGIPASCTLN